MFPMTRRALLAKCWIAPQTVRATAMRGSRQASGFRQGLLELAAKNIADELGVPRSKCVLILCSKEKQGIAETVRAVLEARGMDVNLLLLGSRPGAVEVRAEALIGEVAEEWGLVFLLQPQHAKLLFDTVGRPDQGLKLPTAHLFSDWLIRPESLLRTYGVDMDEVQRFRRALLPKVSAAKQIRITTKAGTDITVSPRGWEATNGEVYTAPIELISAGRIVVDGCVYGGPPLKPFELRLSAGRVANLADLSESDEQQRMVRKDMARDGNANVLAELGIGINPGARADSDLMEAEQTRGTCHFGFGANIAYGGQNQSVVHFDVVVLRPTIEAEGVKICAGGEYSL